MLKRENTDVWYSAHPATGGGDGARQSVFSLSLSLSLFLSLARSLSRSLALSLSRALALLLSRALSLSVALSCIDWCSIPMTHYNERRLRGGIDLAKCAIQAPVFASPHSVQYSTFALDAANKSQLVIAVTALSGYLPVVRNSGNDWTTSAAPYPGEGKGGGNMLPNLLVAMRAEPSLGLNSLRLTVPTVSTAAAAAPPSSESEEPEEESAHYGLLRYDAVGTGQATLVAVNLAAAPGTVQLDLTALPPQLLGQRPRNLLCNDGGSGGGGGGGCDPQPPALTKKTSLAVGGYSVTAYAGLQLPRWQPQGYLYNCSAKYAGPPSMAPIPLTWCFVACLNDSKCDAISVEWVQKHSWPRPASMVSVTTHLGFFLVF